MKQLVVFLFFVSVFFFGCENKSQMGQSPQEFETYYVKIDNTAPARFLNEPSEGNELGRIPTGKVLKVSDARLIDRGMTRVVWYKIEYNGQVGWISQYVTTGERLKERQYVITEKHGEIPLRDRLEGGTKTITLNYIPGGVKLEVLKTVPGNVKGVGAVAWYQVKYQLNTGWIMNLETTGEVLTEIN